MIPEEQLYVKLGGDLDQGSMKFAFQLANLEKPNSSKKTVVFEAKDTRNNLRTSLQRYKEQLEELKLSYSKISLFLKCIVQIERIIYTKKDNFNQF